MIPAKDWQPADDIRLEPNALRAVQELSDNVVVTAGPGAGKTELLAQRADFLLGTRGCPYPRRILAISFKVDAARNIRARIRKRCGEALAARFDSFTFHAFAKRIVDKYRVLLTGQEALNASYTLHGTLRVKHEQITFNDLITLAIHILQMSEYARNSIQQTYTHVFLDEFQDATDKQYELLKEAFLGSDAVLTAVGDAKQRIMGFANALEGIMQTFATDFGAKPLVLYQNFRSDPKLRRMQNRMVQTMEPAAAVPENELVGDEGHIEVLEFGNPTEEADHLANRIERWLDQGVPASEIAVLVRQQPHLIGAEVIAALTARGIAARNEQALQDLTAEPIAALILHLIRVLADAQQSAAYEELLQLVNRSSPTEEMALRRESAIVRLLSTERERFSSDIDARSDTKAWAQVVTAFLTKVTRPVLNALSPAYPQGNRLDELIQETLDAFTDELDKDGDPVAALARLSEEDAIRILTIHKCKGLEFQKVIVLGVEHECFWGGSAQDKRSEFFVGISRAKHELILTWSRRRPRPPGAFSRWDVGRHAFREFLNYASE